MDREPTRKPPDRVVVDAAELERRRAEMEARPHYLKLRFPDLSPPAATDALYEGATAAAGPDTGEPPDVIA